MAQNVPTDWRTSDVAPPPESGGSAQRQEDVGVAAPPFIGQVPAQPENARSGAGGLQDEQRDALQQAIQGSYLAVAAKSAGNMVGYKGNIKLTAAKLGESADSQQPISNHAEAGHQQQSGSSNYWDVQQQGAASAAGYSGFAQQPPNSGGCLAGAGHVKETVAKLGESTAYGDAHLQTGHQQNVGHGFAQQPPSSGAYWAGAGHMKETVAKLGEPGAALQPPTSGGDGSSWQGTGDIKQTVAKLGEPGMAQTPWTAQPPSSGGGGFLAPQHGGEKAAKFTGHMKGTVAKLGDYGAAGVSNTDGQGAAYAGNIKRTAANLGERGAGQPPGSGGQLALLPGAPSSAGYAGNIKRTAANLNEPGAAKQPGGDSYGPLVEYTPLKSAPPPVEYPPLKSAPQPMEFPPLKSAPPPLEYPPLKSAPPPVEYPPLRSAPPPVGGAATESVKVFTEISARCNPNLVKAHSNSFSVDLPSVKVILETSCKPPPSFTAAGLIPLRPREELDVQFGEQMFLALGEQREMMRPTRVEILELPAHVNMDATARAQEQFGEVVLDKVHDGANRTKVGAHVLKYSIRIDAHASITPGAMASNRFDVAMSLTVKVRLEERQGANFQGNPFAAPQINIVAPNQNPQTAAPCAFPPLSSSPPVCSSKRLWLRLLLQATQMLSPCRFALHRFCKAVLACTTEGRRNTRSSPFRDPYLDSVQGMDTKYVGMKQPMLQQSPQAQGAAQYAAQQQYVAQQQYAAAAAAQQQRAAQQQHAAQQQMAAQMQYAQYAAAQQGKPMMAQGPPAFTFAGQSPRQMQAFEVEQPRQPRQEEEDKGGCPCCSIM